MDPRSVHDEQQFLQMGRVPGVIGDAVSIS